MKFKIGDVVYWPTAPTEDESWSNCLVGVSGVITSVYGDSYTVTFNDYDVRCPFKDDELVSEEVYNSPLYKALS